MFTGIVEHVGPVVEPAVQDPECRVVVPSDDNQFVIGRDARIEPGE